METATQAVLPKSGSWPNVYPADYASDSMLGKAYAYGWNNAHGIACHNVPTIGAELWTDSDGRVTVDADNVRDIHQSICYDAESNSRCFSPWEFIAAELNALGYDGDDSDRKPGEPTAEAGWEAYEQGVADSIAADLATYEDSDYGIEPESE